LIAGQIANHYRQAGQDEESADYFKQAGDYARSLFANAEALAHYRTALGLGYPESAELHESIGDLQTLKGDYQTALGTYERAAASLEASDLARLEHKLGEVYQRLGVWERAERHFQSAESLLKESGDLNALAHLYAAWSRTAHQQNEVDRAGQLARQALKIAEAAADDRSLAQAHNMLGILANSDAAPVVAERHLSRSLELAEQLGDPFARMAALNNLALTYRANSKPDQALSLTGTALELSQQLGDRHREAALHNNLADLYHDLGQTEPAMAHLKQAVTIFAEIGAESETLQPALWMLVAW
jgi:tetratricopeptide (TPR) repeat protein